MISRSTGFVLATMILLGAVPGLAQERVQVSTRPLVKLAPPVVVECESLIVTAIVSAGPVDRQEMEGFGAGWSGSGQLFWRPPAPVDEPIRNYPNLRLHLEVDAAGTYALTLVHTVAPDYGTVRVFVRGQPAGDFSGYAESVQWRRFELGERELPAGNVEVVFTVIGKDGASTGYCVGLDRIELRRVS